eukprot:8030873-Alexandrium_andersonii.AAC.1
MPPSLRMAAKAGPPVLGSEHNTCAMDVCDHPALDASRQVMLSDGRSAHGSRSICLWACNTGHRNARRSRI